MGFFTIIAITQGRIINRTITSILRRNLGRARLMRPHPIRILSVKVIVILRINDRRNLIEVFWTLLFKGGELKIGYIPHQASHQIRTPLSFHLAPLWKSRLATRLMKGNITGLLVTFGRRRKIHETKGIGKAVMAVLNHRILVKEAGLKARF